MAQKRTDQNNLAHDVHNVAGVLLNLAAPDHHIPDEHGDAPKGWRVRGIWLHGPGEHGQVEYEFACRKRQPLNDFGPGTCSVIEIKRSGPGAEKLKLKARAFVGNLHGLNVQLSRDLARLYGNPPDATAGFEGAGHRRGRKSRRSR